MALSVRQLLFIVILIINSITQNYLIVHLIIASDLLSTIVCDTILIELSNPNYPQHNISLVSLVFSSDLCKENDYCKTCIFVRLWIIAFTLYKLGIYFVDFNFRGSLPTAKFRENWTRGKFSILQYAETNTQISFAVTAKLISAFFFATQ